MLRDFAYAFRTLRKSPVFAATAILTIAMGIGASTAIFSVTNAVLLRPLPYQKPERLVLACSDMRRRNVKDFPFSSADFIDLRNGARSMFEDFAALNTARILFPRADGTPEQNVIATITTNGFRLLGARVLYGRDFIESDGQPQTPQPLVPVPGAPPPPQLQNFAILSYEYFQRRFGGNMGVLGKPMLASRPGSPVIVGVLSPGMRLFFPPAATIESDPDMWVAAHLAYDTARRNNVQWRVIGRMKDSVALQQAQSAADVVSAELRRNNPVQQTSGMYIRIEPMQKHLVAEVRPAILALTGAVIFLLLIACANVANLMLVRASLRERELAVRTALGGNWWRLVRQMLAESLLIAGLGSVLGLGLAWLGIHELLAIAPANLPRLDAIAIDRSVLAFTAAAGLVAASLFGIAPAWRAAQPDVAQTLRASGRTAGLGGARLLRNIVVVAEVALSFVLLIGSGLMFRSFLALQRVDPGFDPHHLLTFQLLGNTGNTPEKRLAFQLQMRDRLRALPGVESVTASVPLPLTGGFFPIRWGTESALTDPTKFQAVDNQEVLPGYFETLRTPLIAGRAFTDADNAPDRNLVVIDEFLAAKAYPNQSAVGKRILTRVRTLEPEWVEVIGVAKHQRATALTEPGREQIYFTDGFLQHGIANRWAIRTAGDPAKLADAIRAEVAKLGSQHLLTELSPMETYVDKAQAGTRFSLLLIGAFAVIAALLAGVGLYGVLATVVRQRTAEIGVRMALGAAPASIFGLVVGHGIRLSAVGVLAGIGVALWLTRAMTSMLVGVTATDPTTFAAVAVVFFAIAAMASWLPARRAAGLDPTVALREE